MPAEPDGLLPWSWAEERLVACRSYFVATADASGRPHSMPVWGVWSVEDSVFWFSASSGARKVRNLAANPQMAIITDDTREVVSVEGRAHPLREEDVDRMARAWVTKYGDDLGGVSPESIAEMTEFIRANAVFEMIPERAFGIIETPEDFSRRATKWEWESAG